METLNKVLGNIDDFVWGVPLIVAILAVGLLLTINKGLAVQQTGLRLQVCLF